MVGNRNRCAPGNAEDKAYERTNHTGLAEVAESRPNGKTNNCECK